MTIHRTEVRKVLLDYEGKPVELSLEYFERALDDTVFLAGGAFGAFLWLKDGTSLRYKNLSTCQSFDLVSIAGGIIHQQRDDEALLRKLFVEISKVLCLATGVFHAYPKVLTYPAVCKTHTILLRILNSGV